MARNVNKALAKADEPIRTPKGTFIYPWVFTKDQLQDKYSMILAVDKDEPGLVEFKKTVAAFGKKAFDGKFPSDLSWCVRDGNEWLAAKQSPPSGKLADAVTDRTLIVMKSDYAPVVSHVQGGKLVEIKSVDDWQFVYTGAVGAASGILAAFDGKYPAVVYWFSQVAKLGQGEKIGGSSPDKTFGDMYDSKSADESAVGAVFPESSISEPPKGNELDDPLPW